MGEGTQHVRPGARPRSLPRDEQIGVREDSRTDQKGSHFMTQQGGPQGPWQQGPGQQPGSPSGPWQQPGGPTQPPGSWQQPQTPPGGWGPPATPNAWQGPANPAPTQGQPAYTGPNPGYQGYPPPAGPQPGGYPPPPGDQWNPVSVTQPGPEQPKNRTPVIITAIAVVVALLAGAAVWFFAIRDTNDTADGHGTPQQAVDTVFRTLSQSDPIGLADQLDPAEAALFTDLSGDMIKELQRLEVLSSAASVDSMTGTQITVEDLTYGQTITVNDHVNIVELTGGRVTLNSDPANIPLTDTFQSEFAQELAEAQPQSETVNIADAVADNGGPIRVATVKRGNDWYVSLFYTIADTWAQESGAGNPTSADVIPAAGADSPEEAVQQLYTAAMDGNLESVIAVLPPDEMAVLHDYGKLILRSSDADDLSGELGDAEQDLGFRIDDIQFTKTDVTGGTKVSLASATISADGQTARITVNQAAGSVKLETDGQSAVTLDATTIDSYLGEFAGQEDIDPQLLDIIKREFKQLINLGVVTVQVGDDWYVSPIRSFGDVFLSLMRGLEPADVQYLISLAEN